MGDDVGSDEVESLRHENARLGTELAHASDAVRAAEEMAGELRGELIEAYRALDRAAQIESALRATYGGRVFRIGRSGRHLAGRIRRTLAPTRAGR